MANQNNGRKKEQWICNYPNKIIFFSIKETSASKTDEKEN